MSEISFERRYDDGGDVIRARLILECKEGSSRVYHTLDFAEEASRLTTQILETYRSCPHGFGPYRGGA